MDDQISSPITLATEERASTPSSQLTGKFFGGIAVVTAVVYGFLAWSEPHQVITEAQTAAVVVSTESPFNTLTLEAQGAFVADLSSSKILYSHNANVQLPLASITKVMLVLTIADVLTLDDTVTISERAVLRGEGGLTAGETWRVRDLIDYTLVESSNVGAEALAEATDGKIRTRFPQAPNENATVWRMNTLAQELGLDKTYFLNASGLDVSPTQPSAMGSARDATILLAYAHKTIPDVFAATKKSVVSVGPINGDTLLAENTNDRLSQMSGLRIGKTGYTALAGGNLSVVFDDSAGRTLVATVLSSSEAGRFTDMLSIMQAAEH